MGEVTKQKTFTNYTTEEFTSETLEIIKMVLKYEREVARLKEDKKNLLTKFDHDKSEILSDLRYIKTRFDKITKKSTKDDLIKTLDAIYDDILKMVSYIQYL